MKQKKVSCIIPVYNEAENIASVLEIVRDCPLLDEVIVVDDGSKDQSGEILDQFCRIRVIKHHQNQGKAAAVITGLQNCQHSLICMLDSDLKGLTQKNLKDLILPAIDQNCMTLSSRGNLAVFKKYNIVFITGDRVMPRYVLEETAASEINGYGLEPKINEIAIREKLPIFIVDWQNVHAVSDIEKKGLLKGLMDDSRMIQNLFKNIPPRRAASQALELAKIAKKLTPEEQIKIEEMVSQQY